jgi:hypothetical protein
MNWVLVLTIYMGPVPTHVKPVFYTTQAECVAAHQTQLFSHTGRRKRIEGGCFDMSDPRVAAYMAKELEQRSRMR